ncbi:DEAD/DEAH box helicase [Schleiferiaceae bacterium]|nr:DEAD/DEAH box helicase [Schleiferiaceae bacterium]
MPKLKLQQEVLDLLESMNLLPFNTAQIKITSAYKSGQNHWLQLNCLEESRLAIVASTIHTLKSSYEDVARCLILVPDSEIADYYSNLFNLLGKHTDLRVWTAYQGPKILDQKENIYFGADVVIATPKRLNELLNIEGFNSAAVQTLILDSADQLLKVGAISFTQRISDSIPKKQRISISVKGGKGVGAYMDRFAYPFTLATLE